MESRVLGKTGEKATILGFGCMRLPTTDPNDPSSIDMPAATAMLRAAVDRGVNYVDTAYAYHRSASGDATTHGMSENFLARALKDGYREKVNVATKLPTWFMDDTAQMHRVLDEQLKALDVTCIDFYLAHNLNGQVWPKMRDIGMLGFLDEIQKDGRVRHVGFSFHDNYRLFEDALDAYDWSFTQLQYNYLDVDHQAGRRGVELAAARGLGVIVMEPLRGGYLVSHMPEEMRAYLESLRPGRSLADWALRWTWSQPGVGMSLSGMSTMDQTLENCDIADAFAPLDEDEENALARVRDFFHERTKVNCTGCGYCLPCPSGVNIPNVFSMYNDYYLVEDESNRQRAKMIYSLMVRSEQEARHCVACGVCEDKCPQQIRISEEMPKAAALFHA